MVTALCIISVITLLIVSFFSGFFACNIVNTTEYVGALAKLSEKHLAEVTKLQEKYDEERAKLQHEYNELEQFVTSVLDEDDSDDSECEHNSFN